MNYLFNNNESNENIILIVSCGRRFEQLKSTINKLCEHNPQISNEIKKCWVLDDRSTSEDRKKIDILFKKHFKDNYNSVNFNSEKPYYYVNKLNFIKKISDASDIILYLEDDWECCKPLNLTDHVNILKNQNVDSICLTGLKMIQYDHILKQEQKYKNYWKNPWPCYYKSLTNYTPDEIHRYHWAEVRMKNWSNNPSLVKAKVFHQGFFKNYSHYEVFFADKFCQQVNQFFTDSPYFYHIGDEKSLERN